MSTVSKALPNPPNNFSTTLSGNISSSDLTIGLNSVTGLATEGVGVIYQKDSDGNPVTSSLEFIHWTNTSGNNLTLSDTGDRGLDGSASGAQAHSSGDTFEVWVHSDYHFYDWAVVDHGADGTHTASSTTAAGIIEIATAAETTTGTDATRAVSPDGLAGSDYGKRVIGIIVFDDATDVATGDGAGDVFVRIPSILNGFNLVGVAAQVQTAGTTGTTDIQIHNVTQAADMLTTKITIDSAETDSSTAAAAAVIDTANDDVATADQLRIDVDAVSTTAPKGLYVELTFQSP